MIVVPNCTVVVAPRGGRLRRVAPAGATVELGDSVAVIENAGAAADVAAPARGRVGGALAGEGQDLAQGEGVLWLSR